MLLDHRPLLESSRSEETAELWAVNAAGLGGAWLPEKVPQAGCFGKLTRAKELLQVGHPRGRQGLGG